jgi:hypothetical protein
MIVIVSDTSVLIDLERGGLLEHAFSCGMTMAVPDLLYEKELEPYNGAYLQRLGLGVASLNADEVTLAQAIKVECVSLSLPDCFALSCALRVDHALVTGDRVLRAEAERRAAQAYGLLWMLDQMEISGRVSKGVLREGLARIAAHPRCRLPKSEVTNRLDRWKP